MKFQKIAKVLSVILLASTVASCKPKEDDAKKKAEEIAAQAKKEKELSESLLGEYTRLYNEAVKYNTTADYKKRLAGFATAEYNLIYENAAILPWYTRSGTYDRVSKIVPFTYPKAGYGQNPDKYTNMVIASDPLTKEQYKTLKAAYDKRNAAAKTNTKADAEGWISLANGADAVNPAINNGKFTLDGVTINTKNSFNAVYSTQPDSYNYLTTTWQYNSLHIGQMVDGLIMNDQYGRTYGALADKYKVKENDDGTETWTIHIKDTNWVKQDGTVYDKVKAADFVYAMKYVLDPANGSGTSYLPMGTIKGAQDYYNERDKFNDGKREDEPSFDTVGIKAVDDNTIEYTLIEPTPYFLTCLTYGVYYPVSEKFVEAQGSDFAKTADSILANGAFLQTGDTRESQITYKKNPNYYDRDHVYFDNLAFKFVGKGASIDSARKLYEAGDIDSFVVYATDKEGYTKYVTGEDGKGTALNPANPNCYASTSTDQFSFIGYFNYFRKNYEYAPSVKAKTDDEKAASQAAIENVDFRKGFLYGLDVTRYLEYYNKENPVERLNRTYTVKGLASDSDNKDYVSYVEDVYNEKQGTQDVKLVGTEIEEAAEEKGEKAKDPIYDAAKAKQHFNTAKAALEKKGIKADHIVIDVLGDMDATAQSYQTEMFKSIEENSDGWVKININTPTSEDQDTKWGTSLNNYDFSMYMGWGADYGDPKSFLHTMVGLTYDDEGNVIDMGDTLNYLGFTGRTA